MSFRAQGAARLYDPTSGESRPLHTTVVDGRTCAEIALPPSGAVFVVIATDAHREKIPENVTVHKAEISGPWRLSIDGTVLDDVKLGDWTKLSCVGEAVRMFSGTATYRTMFAFDDCFDSRSVGIDLGRVEVCAEVRVNGISCGKRWCYPYRYDVAKALKQGMNVLEVDVTNLWFNRLRYESRRKQDCRRTWTSVGPRDEFPDQPSGMFGPVVIDVRDF